MGEIMNRVICVGGGSSAKEGIELDLWNKIKDKADIFSINFAYLAMPYTPTAQCWLDTSFFRNQVDSLLPLHDKGCKLYTKTHGKYDNIPVINQLPTVKEKVHPADKLYIGTQGLSGFFALSLVISLGYKEIYLLGYDFGTKSMSDINTHFYQDTLSVPSSGIRNPGVYRQNNNNVKKEVKDFEYYHKFTDVNIFNVSPASNITAFNKIDFPTMFSQIA